MSALILPANNQPPHFEAVSQIAPLDHDLSSRSEKKIRAQRFLWQKHLKSKDAIEAAKKYKEIFLGTTKQAWAFIQKDLKFDKNDNSHWSQWHHPTRGCWCDRKTKNRSKRKNDIICDCVYQGKKYYNKLSFSELMRGALCHQTIYGVNFGVWTRYAVIDIDFNSPYHCEKELNRLRRVLLDRIGLKSTVFRSSTSGGYHIYLYFEDAIESAVIRAILLRILTESGFEMRKGTCEVFPNTGKDTLGLGLRLPLMAGFAFINQETYKTEFEAGMAGHMGVAMPDAFKRLIADLEAVRNDPHAVVARLIKTEQLRKAENPLGVRSTKYSTTAPRQPNAVASTKRNSDVRYGAGTPSPVAAHSKAAGADFQSKGLAAKRKKVVTTKHHLPISPYNNTTYTSCTNYFPTSIGSPGFDPEIPFPKNSVGLKRDLWFFGYTLFEKGLSRSGERRNALFALSHYFFYGDETRNIEPMGYGREKEREKALIQWIRSHHNNQSTTVNGGNWKEVEDDIHSLCYWKRGQYDLSAPKSVCALGGRNSGQVRAKVIKESILATIKELANVGVASATDFALISGVDRRTLAKPSYKLLWSPLIDVWKGLNPSVKKRGRPAAPVVEAPTVIESPFRFKPQDPRMVARLAEYRAKKLADRQREEQQPATFSGTEAPPIVVETSPIEIEKPAVPKVSKYAKYKIERRETTEMPLWKRIGLRQNALCAEWDKQFMGDTS